MERLRKMHADGAPVCDAIVLLRLSDVPKPVASIALCMAKIVSSLPEAREAVDGSVAFAGWPGAYCGTEGLSFTPEPIASAA